MGITQTMTAAKSDWSVELKYSGGQPFLVTVKALSKDDAIYRVRAKYPSCFIKQAYLA